MYVMLYTKVDIYYVVGIVSQYKPNIGINHYEVVKHILKYLKRTKDYTFSYSQRELTLMRYNDLGVLSRIR